MGAIKNKEYVAGSQNLTTRYGGVPVIYVESEEDEYIFGKCWFRESLSAIEFKPAADKASISGCSGVIEAVSKELQAGNSAWGIVDRDTTMAHNFWYLVDETDDSTFEAAKPFGQSIKVLTRWEMESYLVDAEALEHHRAALNRQQARSIDDVRQELLDCCDVLVPHAAINAVLHEKQQTGLSDGYTNRFSNRAQVDSDIKTIKFPHLSPEEQSRYGQHTAKVDAFDTPAASTETRITSMLRRVHGKAVLSRFQSLHKIQVDLDGLLAKRIEEQGRIPDEITTFVNQVFTSSN